eukprot:5640027-Amphidinium_carterae.1
MPGIARHLERARIDMIQMLRDTALPKLFSNCYLCELIGCSLTECIPRFAGTALCTSNSPPPHNAIMDTKPPILQRSGKRKRWNR